MKVLKKNADMFTCTGIAVFVFLVAFFFLGFAKYGLSIPFSYAGGDDYSGIVTAKLLKESGWFWFNDRIGAPFGANSFDFTANLLLNVDLIIAKVISLFIRDPIAANNFRYLLIFPMCAVSAFCVLRTLKIGRVISAFGSVAFALTPYIFFRGIGHFSLSACYFIPLSILLCIWAGNTEQDGYLKLNSSFFKSRKNVLTVIFALLIANNGIGYYAFFTCFFLCVVALCNLINTGNLKSVTVPLKTVSAIVFFTVIALTPAFIANAVYGSNPEVARDLSAGAEIYGLKISQLFLPLNSHGIGFLQTIIDGYNNFMPLVNENRGAYLGIPGIIGFIFSLIFLVRKEKNGDSGQMLYLLSEMNILAVILATVGGFSSMVSFIIPSIRSYNRISIFISFISILFLCTVMQRAYESKTLFKNQKIKRSFVIGSALIMSLGIIELFPSYGMHDEEFEINKAQYMSDKAFVSDIEETLGKNAMVFQYPYHPTPEGGAVNGMMDYHLYAGYINSDTLRWSYGGTKGRETDKWLRYVSTLSAKDQIDTICRAGFTGIYIDTRAYDAARLNTITDTFSKYLGKGKISENGNLMFYDLRAYIAENGINIDPSVYTDYTQNNVYGIAQMEFSGTVTHGFSSVTLQKGSEVYGPGTVFDRGTYTVVIYGKGLGTAEYGLTVGGTSIGINEVSKSDTEIRYTVIFEKKVSRVEFKLYNNTDNAVEFYKIEIIPEK